MRLKTAKNYAAGIIASLSFLFSFAAPVQASSIDYRSVCQSPGVPDPVPVDSCVGITPPTFYGAPTSVDMNLAVTSTGGTITDSIQGSMAFSVPGGNFEIEVYTRQAIIPLPGNLAFSNNFGILVWADQPLSGYVTMTTEACSFFTPSPSGFGGGGDCHGSGLVKPIIDLGTNPNLENATSDFASVAGEAIIAPGGTFSPGYWENEFIMEFSGGGAPSHIQIQFTDGSATLQSAVLAPEPGTIAELGVGLGFMLLIAYRRRLQRSDRV